MFVNIYKMESIVEKLSLIVLSLRAKFIDHPTNVCMDYATHCRFSLNMTRLHAYGTYTSFVHAFFPWLYPIAVSELNVHIADLIEKSRCKATKED